MSNFQKCIATIHRLTTNQRFGIVNVRQLHCFLQCMQANHEERLQRNGTVWIWCLKHRTVEKKGEKWLLRPRENNATVSLWNRGSSVWSMQSWVWSMQIGPVRTDSIPDLWIKTAGLVRQNGLDFQVLTQSASVQRRILAEPRISCHSFREPSN